MRATNLQNIPRKLTDVKQCFVPKLDAFLFLDYVAVEVRLLAFYLSGAVGDDSMAAQFRTNPDYDPHKETAQLLFGADITDEQRQIGKVLNFSIQYGGGSPTIMRQLGCTYTEAREYLNGFHKARPSVKILAGELAAALGQRGYIVNLYGRRGHVQEDHKALNWLIQSCAADMMKGAMIRVDHYLTSAPWDIFVGHMVNTVHDEIILDVTTEEIPKLVKIVPTLMEDSKVTGIVPIPVDIEVSYSTWADKESYV